MYNFNHINKKLRASTEALKQIGTEQRIQQNRIKKNETKFERDDFVEFLTGTCNCFYLELL